MNRPCSTIGSRRLLCSTATGPAAGFSFYHGLSHCSPPSRANLGASACSIFQVFWLTASSNASSSFSLSPSVPFNSFRRVRRSEQFLERLHLPRYLLGFEVFQAFEAEIDFIWPASESSLSLFSTAKTSAASCFRGRDQSCPVSLRQSPLLEFGQGLLGLPVKSPRTPTTNGSSLTSMAPPVSTS